MNSIIKSKETVRKETVRKEYKCKLKIGVAYSSMELQGSRVTGSGNIHIYQTGHKDENGEYIWVEGQLKLKRGIQTVTVIRILSREEIAKVEERISQLRNMLGVSSREDKIEKHIFKKVEITL